MLKKYFLLACCVCLSIWADAQQDTTLVYARRGIEKDPIRSKLKKDVVKKDSLWTVNLSTKKGKLQETISFADEELSVRKGPYALYNEESQLVETGNYNRGYKIGPWTSYYPNQKPSVKSTYSWGKLTGIFQKFWDNGQLKEEVNYANGKKSGDRNMYYRDGKQALKEFYEADKKITGTYFDQEGKTTSSLKIIQPPKFPGGTEAFYDFLRKEIKYPPNAQKNNVSGTVKLSFTVMKNGRIDNIKVIDSPDEELTREAIRVLRYNMEWLPGLELGEPVEMKHTVPIKFSL